MCTKSDKYTFNAIYNIISGTKTIENNFLSEIDKQRFNTHKINIILTGNDI